MDSWISPTLNKIVGQQVVPVPSSQANVVHVAVGVDEARGNDLVSAVDDFHIGIGRNLGADLCDLIALDQEVGLDAFGGVVGLMDDHDAVLEKD